MPDAFIGVDIIAGARGETEKEWERSFSYAESLPVSRYHVFPYSERPGTKALGIDHQVSQEEKHRRVAALTRLSDEKLRDFSRRFIGSSRPVLWEHPDAGDDGIMYGHTDNYLRVCARASSSHYNTITPALITCFKDVETLMGSVDSELHNIEGENYKNF